MSLRQSPFPAEAFRTAGYRAIDLIAEQLDSMADKQVFQPMPQSHREHLLSLELPTEGEPVDELLQRYTDDILPYPMGNGHPRFFGWVNSPPDPAGILAELLAAALDPSCAGGDHAAIYLERSVTRWLAELVGFPVEGSMGLLTSGGSMASLTAIATARHRAAKVDGWNDRERGMQQSEQPMVMYLSSEGHTTMVKAAELLGIGNSQVRRVPVNGHFRMDPQALREMIETDLGNGDRPFLVAASAGTVSTGAIDDFDALADICAEYGLWMHVDGAYGAVAALDNRLHGAFSGIERADSLALDPHKWLSVPVECGCVLIRDASMMRDTFSLVPEYLRTSENAGFGGLPWFSEYGFQQTRGFRALKVWMVLAANGRDGLAATIRRHIDQARELADLIQEDPALELLAEPTLSIVCFRVRASKGEDSTTLNNRVMDLVQESGKAFVTQAVLKGEFWLRANVLHYATTTEDLKALLQAVHEAASRVRAETHLGGSR